MMRYLSRSLIFAPYTLPLFYVRIYIRACADFKQNAVRKGLLDLAVRAGKRLSEWGAGGRGTD